MDDARLAATFRGTPCLVTGGAGFIGGHLCRMLLGLGARVRVLDDLSTGRRENVASGVEFLEGSVADAGAVRRAVSGCAFVFHLAAFISVAQSVTEPDVCVMNNVVGTERVLSAGKAAGVRRVVLASTCTVYGDQPNLPSVETDPTTCCSPYAASKLAAEGLCQAFARTGGPSTACLRFFNVYGPGQLPTSAYAAVISAFSSALRAGRTPTIFGDGEQTRDFVFVEDVARANLLAAACPAELRGEAFNVGTGARISLLTLLATMGGLVGRTVTAEHGTARAGDVRHSQADISRARSVLGYGPRVMIEQGLRRTLDTM